MPPESFVITQNAILKNQLGAILILRHKTGRWLLPGGKVNKGETLTEGLRRELEEELNLLDFEIERIIDIDSWIENGSGYLVITHLVRPATDWKPTLSNEHDEYLWIEKRQVDDYDFWHPKIKERIKLAFELK